MQYGTPRSEWHNPDTYKAIGFGNGAEHIGYVSVIKGNWRTAQANAELAAEAPAMLEALRQCKAAAENGDLPPSARLELVRDYATPAIAEATGGSHD